MALYWCRSGEVKGTQYILRYIARVAAKDRGLYGVDAFTAVQAWSLVVTCARTAASEYLLSGAKRSTLAFQ